VLTVAEPPAGGEVLGHSFGGFASFRLRPTQDLVRRRHLAPLFLAAIVLAASADAATDPLQARARDVRNAIPAAEAWYADHNTYGGMTLAKLRRAYDRSLKGIAVRRANKKGYCIQSTRSPLVHYAGPGGPMRKSRCGVRGAEVPRPGETPAKTPTTPEEFLRWAQPAIAAYAADHGSYLGMTVEALNKYYAVEGITIAWATRDRYCTESGADSTLFHLLGPSSGLSAGACPPSS
jgi:hypothetical protein